MHELKVSGLRKCYGDVPAVADFSYTFPQGKITTIVGPSGSGKSSTLLMIAGLLRQDAGSIELDGQDVSALDPERRDMGMVFQNYALFPHLNVRENVEFGLRVRGVPRQERRRRAEEVLHLVQIQSLSERSVDRISGGEQQRVALARALAFRPKVLLMDEPLSALDAKLREQLRGELFRLLQQLNVTTIYVTHDQVEAMSLGNGLIVMNQGRIEQSGAPLDVYCQPANTFVAGFLGSANIFSAECVEKDGRLQIQLAFATIDAPINATSGACWVMIRPEDMILSPSDGANFHALFESSFFMGNQIRLNLSVSEKRITMDVENQTVFDRNKRIPIRINAEKAVTWPRVSGDH